MKYNFLGLRTFLFLLYICSFLTYGGNVEKKKRKRRKAEAAMVSKKKVNKNQIHPRTVIATLSALVAATLFSIYFLHAVLRDESKKAQLIKEENKKVAPAEPPSPEDVTTQRKKSIISYLKLGKKESKNEEKEDIDIDTDDEEESKRSQDPKPGDAIEISDELFEDELDLD